MCVEEAYFTFTMSPVFDPGAPHHTPAVANIVVDTSENIIRQRRLRTVGEVAACTLATCAYDACSNIASMYVIDQLYFSHSPEILKGSTDITFAMFYILNEQAGSQVVRFGVS